MLPPASRLVPVSLFLAIAVACDDKGELAASDAGTTAGESQTAGEAGAPLSTDEVGPVAEHYAAIVHATYADALARAVALEEACAALVSEPTADTHEAAKQAWLVAREPYGSSEAFRFYNGPIDNDETGPEGQLNAWPMDEAYVDYVDESPGAGIINDLEVEITRDNLIALNEQGGEENVATGYHAIEFLLWGQDLSATGPGERTHEDFVDGGTAPNADRRRLYLETVASLLVDDLKSVEQAWAPDVAGNYREAFVSNDPQQIVVDIMRGIGTLAGAELAEERINVAFDTKLQEDEHSCFSDNTLNDIIYNFSSVKNVYYGEYGALSGPGIDDLVRPRDADLADTIDRQFEATQRHIEALEGPFDQAIIAPDDDPRRVAIAVVVSDLRELGDLFVRAAALMDITLNTSLE